MTDTIAPVVPAGWYDDPADPVSVRWWSGAEWTIHTAPKQVAPAPYVMAPVVAPGSAQTLGVWLIAFLPLVGFGITGILIGFYLGGGPLIPGVAGYPVVVGLSWLFGWLDVRELRRRGYSPPPLLWMLLVPPLAYLIARGRILRKQGARTWPPEVVFVAIFSFGFFIAYAIAALAMGATHLPAQSAQNQVAQPGQSYYAGTFGPNGTPTQATVEEMLATALAPDGSFPVDCSEALVARGMDFVCWANDTLSPTQLQLNVNLCACGDMFFTYDVMSDPGGPYVTGGELHGVGNGIVVAQTSSAGSIPDETLPWLPQVEDSLAQWGGFSFVDCSVSAGVIDKVSTFDCFAADGDTPYDLSVTITDLGNIEFTPTPLNESGAPSDSENT